MSVTLNRDLYAKAKAAGLNVSQVAEAALAQEVERRAKELLRAEITQDLVALNEYTAKYGSFTEAAREFLQSHDVDQTV